MTTLGGADREYEVIDRLENQKSKSQQLLDKLEDTHIVGEVGGVTTEIGTGIGLDAATHKLLYGGPKGIAAYGVINFLGGAGSNYIAQQARTVDDLEWYNRDWGEVLSSGLLGIIPGMGGKAGKFTRFVGDPNTYKRAITSGAATGVADQVIRQGWNEQRLPTVGEVTVGAVAGGTLGPVFKKSFDEVGKILNKYTGKTAAEINEKLTTRERSRLTSLHKKVLEVYQKGNPQEIAAVMREFRRSQFNFEKLQGKYANYKDFDEFERATKTINNKLLNNLDSESISGDIGETPIDFRKFGYTKFNKKTATWDEVDPTQIAKVKKIPGIADEQIKEVSESLFEFYTAVDNYLATKFSVKEERTADRIEELLREYDFYWANPFTNNVYKAKWVRGKKGNKGRFGLSSVKRDLLENQQSSITQQKATALLRKYRSKANEIIKGKDQQLKKKQIQESKEIDQEVKNEIRAKEEELKLALIKVNYELANPAAAYTRNQERAFIKHSNINQQLKNLYNGEFYIEHGYRLTSEKIRNQVKDSKGIKINTSKEFQLGDAVNQSIVFEKQNLNKDIYSLEDLKSLFELVIDWKLPSGEYQYPNLVVNMNKKISQKQGIIRIEALDTLRVEGSQLKGDLATTKKSSGVFFDYDKEFENIKSTDDIVKWLESKGIAQRTKKYTLYPEQYEISTSKKPKETLRQLRLRIRNAVDKLD